jgi:hypothetical protein
MEVEMSSNVKSFDLFVKRREARSWDNKGAFRCVKLQSTAEIFLATDHTRGVHNASVT